MVFKVQEIVGNLCQSLSSMLNVYFFIIIFYKFKFIGDVGEFLESKYKIFEQNYDNWKSKYLLENYLGIC